MIRLPRRAALLGALAAPTLARAQERARGSVAHTAAPRPTSYTVKLENAGPSPMGAGITTFQAALPPGVLPAGRAAAATVDGTAVAVQREVVNTHPDGSGRVVRFAVARPAIAGGGTPDAPVVKTCVLAAAAAGVVQAAAMDAAAAFNALPSIVVETTIGGATTTWDVKAALVAALSGAPDRQDVHGPLVTGHRVELLPRGTSRRIVADGRCYATGAWDVDFTFANDRAFEAAGGTVDQAVVVRVGGAAVVNETVRQYQYQDWYRLVSSGLLNGSQGLGSATRSWLNVRHDRDQMHAGGAPRVSTALNFGSGDNYNKDNYGSIAWAEKFAAATWGKPLSANGLVRDWESSGGRDELGFESRAGMAWLGNGDVRAAKVALVQAEFMGHTGIAFYIAASRRFCTTQDQPKFWAWSDGSQGMTRLPQPAIVWGYGPDQFHPDIGAHTPAVSYVPALLTGRRTAVDRVLMTASYNLHVMGPGWGRNGVRLSAWTQTRAQAWALRGFMNAAYLAADGTTEQTYWSDVVAQNLAQMRATATNVLLPKQGAVGLWWPGYNGYSVSVYQNGYLWGVWARLADQGYADAAWLMDRAAEFFCGLLENPAQYNPRDAGVGWIAVAPQRIGGDGTITETASPYYTTLADIYAGNAAAGYNNKPAPAWGNAKGTGNGDGIYGQIPLALLAWHVLAGTGKAARCQAAYRTYANLNVPHVARSSYAQGPQFAVCLPSLLPA